MERPRCRIFTMDARGTLERAQMVGPCDPKVHSPNSLRNKGLCCIDGKNDVVYMVSPISHSVRHLQSQTCSSVTLGRCYCNET